jgi:hypothetical protein
MTGQDLHNSQKIYGSLAKGYFKGCNLHSNDFRILAVVVLFPEMQLPSLLIGVVPHTLSRWVLIPKEPNAPGDLDQGSARNAQLLSLGEGIIGFCSQTKFPKSNPL